MHTFYKRVLWGTLIAGGITLLSATAANATETTGDDGLLSGTQGIIAIEAPVTIGGNAVSLIGDSSSSGATTTAPAPSVTVGSTSTSGSDGVGSGSQAIVSVSVPITVGGNAVSVIGDSSSTDAATTGGSDAPAAQPVAAETSGEDSILGGTQAIVSAAVPVTVGGNAVSVIGDSSTSGATTTGGGSTTGGDTTGWTSGEDSILGGTQILAPIALPVTIGGNAVSVIGDSTTTDATTGTPNEPTNPVDTTDPTDPVDPVDPTDPVTPTDPGTTDPGTTHTDEPTAMPASNGTATAATPAALAALAETGGTGTPWGYLLAGALLLAAGALIRRLEHRVS